MSFISSILKRGKDKGQCIGDRIKELREIVALWLGYTARHYYLENILSVVNGDFSMEQLTPAVGDLTLWVLQHRSNAFF